MELFLIIIEHLLREVGILKICVRLRDSKSHDILQGALRNLDRRSKHYHQSGACKHHEIF